jgi:hypothetical protein
MEKVICLVLLLAILGVSVATLVKKEDCKNKEKYCGASSSPQNNKLKIIYALKCSHIITSGVLAPAMGEYPGTGFGSLIFIDPNTGDFGLDMSNFTSGDTVMFSLVPPEDRPYASFNTSIVNGSVPLSLGTQGKIGSPEVDFKTLMVNLSPADPKSQASVNLYYTVYGDDLKQKIPPGLEWAFNNKSSNLPVYLWFL